MNTLSWLIYFAEVVGNVGKAVGVAAAVSLVLAGLAALFCTVGFFCTTESWEEESHNTLRTGMKFSYSVLVVGLLVGLISQFIPSTKTVYAIAASEMGEVVVKSEEAQEVFKALKDRVMDELKIEEKKE